MPGRSAICRIRVEVVHAYSPTAARREAFGRNFDFPLTERLETILEDRSVEAVLILTPPNTHLDLVGRCAAAGKHILLEKPIEITHGARRSPRRGDPRGRRPARHRVAEPLSARPASP